MKRRNFLLLLCSFILSFCCFSNHSNTYASYISSYAEPTVTIRQGCYGSGVKWVQDMLNHNGYQLSVDGNFGSATLSAVKNFQSRYGLTIDGLVGRATRAALKTHANTPTNTRTQTMYTTANLNLRTGNSTNYSILLTIPKNSRIQQISKCSNNWSYISYQNTYGYVSNVYLSATNPATAPSPVTPTNGLPTFTRNTTDLMKIIQNCKSYYAQNHFAYSIANGARKIPADQSVKFGTEQKYYTDCSCYVSWVLYEYALANQNTAMKNYFSYQRNSATFKTIGDNGGNNYLSVVSKKTPYTNVSLIAAKPGDILVSNGHVEFFQSYKQNADGTIQLKVYNCGSTTSIQYDGITTSATKNIAEITYILRVK